MVTIRTPTRLRDPLLLACPNVRRSGYSTPQICGQRQKSPLEQTVALGFAIGVAVMLFGMSVGCASKGWLPPTNMDGQYHTVTLPEGYKNQRRELAVLVGRNARIEDSKLVYGCFYQTEKGVVRIEQSYECEPSRKL